MQDWSTAAILAETVSAGRMLTAAAVALPLTIGFALVLPATPGNIAAEVVLGVVGLFGAIGPVVLLLERQRYRRRLLAQDWRRCAAAVVLEEQPVGRDRLIVREYGESFLVRGFLVDVPEVVISREEVFLLGPDEDGRALLRVAGLCRIFAVRRVPGEAEPVVGIPADPYRPPGERELRSLRHGARSWIYAAAIGVVGAVVLVLGRWPVPAPLALVVGGVLVVLAAIALPVAVPISRLFAAALAAAEAATAWTSLPITLLPRDPSGIVAGLIQVGNRTTLVQFPIPDLDVITNIADTDTIWIWGAPTGVVAVGVPQLPLMTFGVLQDDRDKPPDEPQPWLLRVNDPGLRRIPVLQR